MRDKYLPIGSVVLLKGGTKKVMITGFCSIAEENQEKIYDYCGCIYPEGYLSSDEVCLFDHDQISEVYFVGFEDEEEKEFKDNLVNVVKEFENSSIDDKIDFFEDHFDEVEDDIEDNTDDEDDDEESSTDNEDLDYL